MGGPARRRLATALAVTLALVLAACGNGGGSTGRQQLTLWFWGAPPAHQKTMEQVLVEGFNQSQDKYALSVTYNNNVDTNVQVALAANKGPDVVYSSGPSFAAVYAAGGKLADLGQYAEKYGWKSSVLGPMYDVGTVGGRLYSLPNSVNTYGVFYSKKVLQRLGVPVPTTFAQLVDVMNRAKAVGMYASVTGNKGWKPVNLDYASIFLNHDAGPGTVYDALAGKIPWTDPSLERAVAASASFYQSGYLGGADYSNLNFDQSMQLLAAGRSPFFLGPTLEFQFATDYFNDAAGNTDDLGFAPFPNINTGLASPSYALGTTASLSVNANSPNKDGAAEVINYMMSERFFNAMTKSWPGYWGVPLKSLGNASASDFTGLSSLYVSALKDLTAAVGKGNYGLDIATFFPPATQTALTNIDTVWLGTATPQQFLQTVEAAYQGDKAKNLVPPIPEPGR